MGVHFLALSSATFQGLRHPISMGVLFLPEQHKDRIEVYYLPSYSPELNPDEYLNNDLKQNLHRDGLPKDKSQLDAKVSVAMFMLEGRPKKIRAFFRHAKVKYAA